MKIMIFADLPAWEDSESKRSIDQHNLGVNTKRCFCHAKKIVLGARV